MNISIIVVIAMMIIGLIGLWLVCKEYAYKETIKKHQEELDKHKALKEYLDKEIEVEE